MSKIVCITGVNGWVGSWIAKVCVDAGWQVRGTVRDAKHHHADLHAINHSAGSHAQPHSLTVVEVTDLAKESEEFNNAIKGCSALIHVANPIGDSAKGMSDEEFVAKSVAQVEVVMNAAAKAGVKRIVVTATMASICGSQRKQDPDHMWNETDWNDEPSSSYSKAKTTAERKVWEFAKSHADIGVTTIHPAMVLGPLLPKQEPRSTIGHFVGMFSEKNVQEGVPAGIFGVCDVRDVADAHLFALTSPDAVGQRIMVTSTATYTTLEVCEAVQRLFPQLPVPSKFKEKSSDLTKCEKFLGRKVRTLDVILKDSVDSLLERGHLHKK